jgi:hypothetical protein
VLLSAFGNSAVFSFVTQGHACSTYSLVGGQKEEKMRKRILCVTAVPFLLAVGNVRADISIYVPPVEAPNGSALGSGITTVGQTFTVPTSDPVLDSFTVWLDHVSSAALNFGAYVMEWDGSEATGPILWESLMQTSTAVYGAREQFVFSPDGLELAPGGAYVFFLSTLEYSSLNPLGTACVVPLGQEPYSGGNLAVLSVPMGNSWTSVAWYQHLSYDIGFQADFRPVPLPGAVLLGTIGLLYSGWRLRRRT